MRILRALFLIFFAVGTTQNIQHKACVDAPYAIDSVVTTPSTLVKDQPFKMKIKAKNIGGDVKGGVLIVRFNDRKDFKQRYTRDIDSLFPLNKGVYIKKEASFFFELEQRKPLKVDAGQPIYTTIVLLDDTDTAVMCVEFILTLSDSPAPPTTVTSYVKGLFNRFLKPTKGSSRNDNEEELRVLHYGQPTFSSNNSDKKATKRKVATDEEDPNAGDAVIDIA